MSIKPLLLGTLSVICLSVQAQPLTPRTIIAPLCLAKQLTIPYKTLANKTGTHDKSMLIQLDQAGIRQLIAIKSKQSSLNCGRFQDVSNAWHREFIDNQMPIDKSPQSFLAKHVQPATSVLPKKSYAIHHQTQVQQLLTQLNPQNIWNYLTQLTHFPDRYADSENGLRAAKWIKDQITSIATLQNRQDVQISLLPTTGYRQPSVIVKVGESSLPGVVISAHSDTLPIEVEGEISPKPGADDNGSGTATVLEIARTIIESGMRFKRPLYFIWYAAEEEGFIGSQQIVNEFEFKHIPIDAVLHLDMTGWNGAPANKNATTMWLINDYVDANLTQFVAKLIKEYVHRPVAYFTVGGPASDYVTWTQKGIPAASPFEASMDDMNRYIHSDKDTLDKLSLDHMTDYAKLSLAFAIELAEPARN